MNYKPILIVPGEPNSIFSEIFFKTLKKKKFKSPIVLISSKKLIIEQMKKLGFNFKINETDLSLNIKNKKNLINIINVDFKFKKPFSTINHKSNNYINNCFDLALEILNKKKTFKFINGPISKKHFLNKKYLGITEFLTDKFQVKKYAMLIYHKELSVSPITTHLPLKMVIKKINKKIIIEKIKLIDLFFRNSLNKKPKIAVLGINPHCETIDIFDEDKKIVSPAIQNLKKGGININGPFSSDTMFLKQNRKNFDVIVGMYHDQVLTPIKTLYEYEAINITLGLPFTRISPDHGPNEKMIGKNLSDPTSLIKALEFLDQ